MGFQPVGKGMDIDNEALRTRCRQPIQHVVDQRPTTDLDQGFGPVIGQRTHAGAQTRRQDKGCFRTHAFSLSPNP
ncbi:hypothetical protein ABI_03800 [Asticcacaulis biprosthecium C19]|uniref:Uncharacterized protein n=1 Tax=Asticcacaulis biprosthecium C19 TaxID=715226 RepID=F4QJJ7_9CAUL|nr:hypothetical protein ABI_03800 [Asticcacaulis biprosthecium C19]